MKYNFIYRTFSAYWLDNAIKGHLSDSSYRSYHNKINRYVNPYIGEIPLADIRKIDVQDTIYKLQQQTTLSINSIRTVHTILNKSLKYAMEMELIQKNPAMGIQLPQAVKYKPTTISHKEFDNLFLLTKGTHLEIPVLLAGRMGLRRGEILALQWKDVDFGSKTLSITKNLVDCHTISLPKGRNATRALVIPDDVLEVLQRHDNIAGTQDAFIVQGRSGKPHGPSWLSNGFAKFIEDNGLPKIRFHDLRHLFSYYAHYSGMPVKQLSQILGHSTAAISLDYYVADM